jgi:hypothetical protein
LTIKIIAKSLSLRERDLRRGARGKELREGI